MADKKEALSDELTALADDLKSLFETLVRDPKEQAKKERRWRILYGVTGAVFTIGARQVAARAWRILTGEMPPTKRGAPQQPRQQPPKNAEPSEPSADASERATETATAG
jgi:hypothetical protein